MGALVIVNLKGMLMQFREIPYLWRRDQPECVGVQNILSFTAKAKMQCVYLAQYILLPRLTSGVCLQVVWVGTCLGAILLGLDIGLAVGLGLELLTVIFRAQL